MTYKFFLAGHIGFYNRGCEALVRGIVQALTNRLGPCEFVSPSTDIDADRRQWPDAGRHSVRFIPLHRVPAPIRWWTRLARNVAVTPGQWWPLPDVPAYMADEIAASDAVIVTGGDVLSLDYSPGSLLRWVAQAEAGMRRGVPIVLWASSVGPFGSSPAIERRMVAHLRRYASLSTRETHSQAYLQSLGLRQSMQTADPAFLLEPEPLDTAALLPAAGPNGVLGFNVSPVTARARARAGGDVATFEADIVAFWRDAVHRHGLSVALVPHVDPPDAHGEQSDTAYMRELLRRAADLGSRIRLLPHTLNAAQLKCVLAACRYFIGARTHATIGAVSSGVPTLSIAYSVKAKGINQDLFGHLRYVVEAPAVSRQTLLDGLQSLIGEDADIRAALNERIAHCRVRAQHTAELVAAVVRRAEIKVAA